MNASTDPAQPAAPAIWTTSIQVHSYDVEPNQMATPAALCRYFLEAAWNHAEALGVGFSHLARQDVAWVLARLLVRFAEYPRWGTHVVLNTWPSGMDSVFALRDFEFTDQAGKVFLAGTSSWVIVHRVTKRPQRMKLLGRSLPGLASRRALPRDAAKLPVEQDGTAAGQRTAYFSDTDVNGHVNSVRYLDWVLDSYAPDFRDGHTLAEIEANYVGETFAGEKLTLVSGRQLEAPMMHWLLKERGSCVCRVALTWKPA